MMAEQVQPNSVRRVRAQQVSNEHHVAEALAHLLAIHAHHRDMRPDQSERPFTERSFTLRNFTFVMREDQIGATPVNRDLCAEELIAQCRTLDVPARAAAAPGAVPARLVGLTRPALPEREIELILFAWIVHVSVILLSRNCQHLLTAQSRQHPVVRTSPHTKEDAAAVYD